MELLNNAFKFALQQYEQTILENTLVSFEQQLSNEEEEEEEIHIRSELLKEKNNIKAKK